MLPTIQLANGKYYDFTRPDPSVLDLETIAHSLSHMCRFSGHVSRFYSVAEHCVRCSYVGPDDEAAERLFHDAAEALVVDLPSPLKRMDGLETYRRLDHEAEETVATRFGLRYPWPASVKEADLILLRTERRDLMPHTDNDHPWSILDGVEPLDEDITRGAVGDPFIWKSAFVSRAHQLGVR